MATLQQITYDILMLANRSVRGIESRLEPRQIEYKIHNYRAKTIKERYTQTRQLDMTWVQSLGRVKATEVTVDDDPNIADCDCKVGKIKIPDVMSLNNDLGIYRVVSGCRKLKYHYISPDRFFHLQNGTLRKEFPYHWRINNDLYFAPYRDEVIVELILEDPTQATITDTTRQNTIVSGTSYTIDAGSVVYDGVSYSKGSTFVGTATTTYTGNGTVVLTNTQRDFDKDIDKYPVSAANIDAITMQILTKDLAIEARSLGEIKNQQLDDNTATQQTRT